MNFKEYIHINKNRFINELKEFLSIKSISALKENIQDMHKAVNFLKKKLIEVGINNIKLYSTNNIPILYGEKIIDQKLPTILIYGHYDVQPIGPINLWDSDPFKPIIKYTNIHDQGAIFARGATDDKGQLYMYIKALEIINYYNIYNFNIKIIIEGEEEIGSNELKKLIIKNPELIKSDYALISDTSMIDKNIPAITESLRGIMAMEIEISNQQNKDLHSGIYGGLIINPVNILSNIISNLSNLKGETNIPFFYKNVLNYNSFNKNNTNKLLLPSIDVNGLCGGYFKDGIKTIIPHKGLAKISIRTVPNQNYDFIYDNIVKYINSILPVDISLKTTKYQGANPVLLKKNSKIYEVATNALKKTYKVNTVQSIYGGGSIPIVDILQNKLGINVLLLGFGLESDDAHAPNEHYGIDNYLKGIETILYINKYISF
ncbi:MAG: M20/M25/M40 family metallo-hydrolase [Bacteroides sp.]|nr:MAG: M20/M25/M40 family metallo-hydrolase [Bacteroides sp.]